MTSVSLFLDCPENGIENVSFPSDVRPTMSNYILLVRPVLLLVNDIVPMFVGSYSSHFHRVHTIDHRPGSIADGEERSHTDLRWLHRMPCVAGCRLATKLSRGGRGGREAEGAMWFIDFLRFCGNVHISISRISPQRQ